MKDYMLEWFADCWKEVGGQKVKKYPACAGFTNSSDLLDLSTKKLTDKKLVFMWFDLTKRLK
jgi:hypothetical protein